MYIYTAKFSKKKAVAILIALAALVAAVILLTPERSASAMASQGRVESAADAAAYMQTLGYRADALQAQVRAVTIPARFDDVYERYNAIQKECGFDLTPYRGREAALYTMPVLNYPAGGEVMCDLLVCRGKVVGGGVYTAALDGFMHGLRAIDG